MNLEEYEKMYALEDTYWWFQGKKHIVFSLLEHAGAFATPPGAPPPTAIDIGCGTGLTLAHLRGRTRPVGLDLSPLAMTCCRRRGIRDLARASATRLPLADGCVDLALALDLVEHIEDDRTACAEIARVLRPGGRALITVPAHPFLWSDHDEALHHHRRYTRASFAALLASTPLRLERLTYAITFTFAPIVVFRLVTRPFRASRGPKTHVILLPGWANRFLIALLKVEAWLLRRMNLPIGVSLIAVLRRPAS
jgi:SAM-dependent methyltransferase